ncbi:MAG: GerMN domain-containing protein [Actinobacteria bacterium]|nr:GerMN domain-containing protein [Actinomycetota bacterium]
MTATRRSPARRAVASLALAAAVAAAAVGAASCGVPLDDEPQVVTGATQPPEATPTTSASPTAQEVSAYYLVGDTLEVTRYRVDGEPTLEAALQFLLEVPPTGEAKTRIPPGTSLRSVKVVGDLATIDLTPEIVNDTSGATQKQAFAQLAFTALASEGVTQVRFLVDGKPVEVPTDRANQGTITADDYDPPLNPR